LSDIEAATFVVVIVVALVVIGGLFFAFLASERPR
jgi:cbb3-type cytochrome oxidase subunit 3